MHLSTFVLTIRDTRVSLPRLCVMGVVNRSPDSFYQPTGSVSAAIDQVADMVRAGAKIIDVGGEATNPNTQVDASSPSVACQLERVQPTIEAIAKRFDVLISIDTSEPLVMQAAVEAGAQMINDQRGLQRPGALDMAARLRVPVCLMHWFETPRMPDATTPEILIAQIQRDLQTQLNACLAKGLTAEQLILDPGFGGGRYGKSSHENFYLLSHLDVLVRLGYPVLVGLSRKSMIGDALGGVPPASRLYGSLSAAVIAAMRGASIIRTHDVGATEEALRIVRWMQSKQDVCRDALQ